MLTFFLKTLKANWKFNILLYIRLLEAYAFCKVTFTIAFTQQIVDGKFNWNTSILLSLKPYLVTLPNVKGSSNLIYNKTVCPNQCLQMNVLYQLQNVTWSPCSLLISYRFVILDFLLLYTEFSWYKNKF